MSHGGVVEMRYHGITALADKDVVGPFRVTFISFCLFLAVNRETMGVVGVVPGRRASIRNDIFCCYTCIFHIGKSATNFTRESPLYPK